jgi:phenylpyruvate tautomerase PptA (4-oxalocrotonate tautomerase family)
MPMIDLTFVRGSLDDPSLRRLTDVHAAVCAAAGLDPKGSRALHVWTLIHEVPEGNWAGGGKVIYYRNVKRLIADDAP